MSEIKHDAEQVMVDATDVVKVARRRVVARSLDWLRRHPRTLIAIVAVLTRIAATLGLTRG